MSTTFWVLLGVSIFLCALLVAIALCRAAARGDRQLEEDKREMFENRGT